MESRPKPLRERRPRSLEAAVAADPHAEVGDYFSTPYAIQREILFSPLGIPRNPLPWMLTAVDLDARAIRWNAVLGSLPESAPLPFSVHWGTPALGGPIVTVGRPGIRRRYARPHLPRIRRQ
jgi:quinoprotein glucose dehydrogenase